MARLWRDLKDDFKVKVNKGLEMKRGSPMTESRSALVTTLNLCRTKKNNHFFMFFSQFLLSENKKLNHMPFSQLVYAIILA